MKLIPLTQGKFAKVDDEDFDFLNEFKWFAIRRRGKTWYAGTNVGSREYGNRRTMRMHQFLSLGAENIDHRDLDGTNNTKDNLRFASFSQNAGNRTKIRGKRSSKYKGVSLRKTTGRWSAYIGNGTRGRMTWLGTFDDEIDAALAYDAAARIHFGEFARLNFPDRCR